MENTTTLPAENDTLTDQIVEKTPWWFLSAFGHAVLFALSALFIVMAQPKAVEEVLVVAPARKPEPPPDIEKPKDLVPAEKPLDIPKTVNNPIFKKTEKSTHNESENESELRTDRGQSEDFKSDRPFAGQGLGDTIGGGPGGGGDYGQRTGGGKENLVDDGGGGENTEKAVLDALRWLARHQNPNGTWSMTGYLAQCGRVPRLAGDCSPHGIHSAVKLDTHNFDVGLTGLSLLAFLGAGYSHNSRDTYDGINFGDVVRGGITALMSVQDGEGCVGPRDVEQWMYNHLLGALALSEAYGMTGSIKYKQAAQKAVDFTVAAQNPGKGWKYIFQAGENDTSVTGWAVMVLKSADLSQLDFDRNAYDGARAWLDSASYKVSEGTGQNARWEAGYQFGAKQFVAIPGINDHFDDHPSMTAINMMCRAFIDHKRSDPKVAGGAPVLMDDLPKNDGAAADYYYWYYGSLAMYQYDGPDGPMWKKWNRAMVSALVDHQNRDGDKAGSWEPASRWSCKGGRVYATAINALTLEVYYRYANAFGTAGK